MIVTQFKTDTLLYWKSLLCKEALESYLSHPTMQMLMNGELKNAWFKKLKHHKIYTARLTDADRAVFIVVEHQGEPHLMFVDVILNHKFSDCAFFKKGVIENYLEKNAKEIATELSEADFESVDENVNKARATHIQYTQVRKHREKYISWNVEQQKAIAVQFPAALFGCAGTGKSLVAVKLIIDYNNRNENHLIIYNCPTEKLANQISQLCRDSTEFIANRNTLLFMTDEQLARDQDPSLVNKEFISYSHFANWYEKKRAKGLAPETLYEAFMYYAICDDEQSVLNLGAKKNPYPDAPSKLKSFSIFQSYVEFCRQTNKHDLALMPIQITKKPAYLLVDESQEKSPLQLTQLADAAEHQQVGFFLDPNQKIRAKIATGAFLKQLLTDKKRVAPTFCQLVQSERNSYAVAKVANASLEVMNEMMKGCDEFQSIQISAAPYATTGAVSWVMGSVKDHPDYKTKLLPLLESTDCVVLVRDEIQKKSVAAYLPTDLIFTAAGFQGMESKVVMAVDFLSDPCLNTVESQVQNLKNGYQPHEHFPKNRDDQSNSEAELLLRTIFTAYSRATEHLICIEQKSLNKIPTILAHLQNQTQKASLPILSKANDAEWTEKAATLGDLPQAKAIRERIKKENNPTNKIKNKGKSKKTKNRIKVVNNNNNNDDDDFFDMDPPANILELQFSTMLTPNREILNDKKTKYVDNLMSKFTQLNFEILLKSASFSNLFYGTYGSNKLTVFEWVVMQAIDENTRPLVHFIFENLSSENPIYKPILDNIDGGTFTYDFKYKELNTRVINVLFHSPYFHPFLEKVCEVETLLKRKGFCSIMNMTVEDFYFPQNGKSLYEFLAAKSSRLLYKIVMSSEDLQSPDEMYLHTVKKAMCDLVQSHEGRLLLVLYNKLNDFFDLEPLIFDGSSLRMINNLYGFEWLIINPALRYFLFSIPMSVTQRWLSKLDIDRFYTYVYSGKTTFEHCLQDDVLLGCIYALNPSALRGIAKERFFFSEKFHQCISETIFYKLITACAGFKQDIRLALTNFRDWMQQITERDLFQKEKSERTQKLSNVRRIGCVTEGGHELQLELFLARKDLRDKMPKGYMTQKRNDKIYLTINEDMKRISDKADYPYKEKEIQALREEYTVRNVTWFFECCTSVKGIQLLNLCYLIDAHRVSELEVDDLTGTPDFAKSFGSNPQGCLFANDEGKDFLNKVGLKRPELLREAFKFSFFHKETSSEPIPRQKLIDKLEVGKHDALIAAFKS